MDRLRKEPLVSVIIPCYNAENTLGQCLDSVLDQNYRNLEVLVVDDGSVDKSRAIIQCYEKKDGRVHLLAGSHQGVSSARNLGIRHASGEYLQFADADDYLLENCTRKLVRAMQSRGVDWVICDYLQRHDSGEDMEHLHLAEGSYSRREFLKRMIPCPGAHYYGVLWNKLYVKRLVDSHGLRFSCEVTLGEDFIFNMEYLSLIQRVCCLSDRLYVYGWQQMNSLSCRKKEEAEKIAEHRKMYAAYRKPFYQEKLQIRWRYGMLFYMVKFYFDELDELGADAGIYKRQLYEGCIRGSRISRIEFAGYCFLKKVKRAVGTLLEG